MKGDIQLKSIQIKNIRSLKDTGVIDLPKVTILVGENSSGKSTFLRVFPLVKQSISKRTDGPILWAGDVDDYVDFGSFSETISNDNSKDMEISFSYPLLYDRDRYHYSSRMLWNDLPQESNITYSITIANAENKDYVSRLQVNINESSFKFEINPNKKDTKIYVDDIEINYLQENKNLDMQVSYRGIGISGIFEFRIPSISGLRRDIYSKFYSSNDKYLESEQEQSLPYDDTNRILVLECSLIFGECLCKSMDLSDIYKQIESLRTGKRRKRSNTLLVDMAELMLRQVLDMDESTQRYYCQVFKLYHLYSCYPQIEGYLSAYFRQVHYIAPLRATAERYYRLRNLAIDEVDYQGKNLSVFLNGLSKNRLSSFQEWTQEHFGFKVEVKKGGGHLSVNVAIGETGQSINLSDTGFGYSQILPIITQLWDLSTRKTSEHESKVPLVVAIEQPELHLHPAVQAKLANAFIASIKLAEENGYSLQLLLETHSQTIVNQFGLAIADKKLAHEDVSVVLFEKPFGQSQTSVRVSQYDDMGYLQNWPIGFFAPGV